MAYEGEAMNYCPAVPFDFSRTFAVVVSGDFPNPCGHLILNLGGPSGWYFHVAGIWKSPRYMSATGYNRYLKENSKREFRRTRIAITNPDGAMRTLETLLSKRWVWGALPHNCASFVEEVVRAGGSDAGLYLNCPSIELFD